MTYIYKIRRVGYEPELVQAPASSEKQARTRLERCLLKDGGEIVEYIGEEEHPLPELYIC